MTTSSPASWDLHSNFSAYLDAGESNSWSVVGVSNCNSISSASSNTSPNYGISTFRHAATRIDKMDWRAACIVISMQTRRLVHIARKQLDLWSWSRTSGSTLWAADIIYFCTVRRRVRDSFGLMRASGEEVRVIHLCVHLDVGWHQYFW